ncbi:MAG TPA: hypothetical protein VI873_00305 [Candidatus Peribacteraceae bacterium]|nr:hypothetical protein [Candidatus Peribacteraceae bacterium]
MERGCQTLLLIRPPAANADALDVGTRLQANEYVGHIQGYTNNLIGRLHAVTQMARVRQTIEDVSDRSHIPVAVRELQLRKREIRHPGSHDLEDHWETLRQADILTTFEPTANQVKALCEELMQHGSKRLVVLHADQGERDVLLQDNSRKLAETSVYLYSKTSRKFNRKGRVFFANTHNEEQLKHVLLSALNF